MTRQYKPTERILNLLPSKEKEKDWLFSHALEGRALTVPEALRSSVDLRDDTWWTIGDQLDHGACVGFALSDILWWHFKKDSELQDKKLPLSRRFIWMASKEADPDTSYPTTFLESEGTYLKAALDVARKFGCVEDSDFPFEHEKMSHLSRESFYAIAAKHKIASYFNLRKSYDDWQVVQKNWRMWLASKGPILTGLGVDATWDNVSNTNANLDTYQPKTVRGGHAISIVGYTADRFIVRNSWGTYWGDKGYCYASLAYAQAAFEEAYGVSV